MKNINEMSGPELVAEYNKITGKSIKKFSTKADGVKALTKARAAQPAPAKEYTSKQRVKDGDSRTEIAVELMRKKAYTIPQLMDEFKTTYKNITGTLFFIRKKRIALHANEQLVCTREGMVRYYAIQKTV
jgi:hypothetical protein